MREIVEGIVGVSGEVAQPVHSRILCHGLEAALGVDDGLAATVGLILRKGGVAVVDGGTRPGGGQVVAPGVGRVGARVVGRGDDPAELIAAGEGPTGGGFRPGAIRVGGGLPGGVVEAQDDRREMAEDGAIGLDGFGHVASLIESLGGDKQLVGLGGQVRFGSDDERKECAETGVGFRVGDLGLPLSWRTKRFLDQRGASESVIRALSDDRVWIGGRFEQTARAIPSLGERQPADGDRRGVGGAGGAAAAVDDEAADVVIRVSGGSDIARGVIGVLGFDGVRIGERNSRR